MFSLFAVFSFFFFFCLFNLLLCTPRKRSLSLSHHAAPFLTRFFQTQKLTPQPKKLLELESINVGALGVAATELNQVPLSSVEGQEVSDVSNRPNNGGSKSASKSEDVDNNNDFKDSNADKKDAAAAIAAAAAAGADKDEADDDKTSSSEEQPIRYGQLNSVGGTPLDEQFADVATMIGRDVDMAARVAAVYRKYDVTEMSRNITEDVVEYGRRVTGAFKDKAPSRHIHGHEMDDDPNQPFYTVDLGQIVMQMAKWRKCLPGVHVHYALKCNNSDAICAMIAALGASFDCASLQEIKQVLEPGYARTPVFNKMTEWTGDNKGPMRPIIFAQPAKHPWQMQQAEELGITRTTFDNQDELIKIQQYMPSAEAVLRIKTDDSSAVCQFSSKFGCPMSEARDLMAFAREIGVNIIGVAFHVGSGNNDPTAYHKALRDARELFDYGNEIGFHMTLLDLGGGWAGVDPEDKEGRDTSFEELTAAIRPVLYSLFPLESTEIIAEPGRFFGASSHTLALNVHSKRRLTLVDPQTNEQEVEHQYYLNDGMYHSFNCMYFDHQVPNFHTVAENDTERRLTTMFGPTCDSMDKVMNREMFPELKVGDWLFVPEFGAYTCAAGSTFNGYVTRRKEYVSSLPVGVVPYLAE